MSFLRKFRDRVGNHELNGLHRDSDEYESAVTAGQQTLEWEELALDDGCCESLWDE